MGERKGGVWYLSKKENKQRGMVSYFDIPLSMKAVAIIGDGRKINNRNRDL